MNEMLKTLGLWLLTAGLLVPVFFGLFYLEVWGIFLFGAVAVFLPVFISSKLRSARKGAAVYLAAVAFGALLVAAICYAVLTTRPHWTSDVRWLWHLWCTFGEDEYFVSVVVMPFVFLLTSLVGGFVGGLIALVNES